jgi:hypothetical protein
VILGSVDMAEDKAAGAAIAEDDEVAFEAPERG